MQKRLQLAAAATSAVEAAAPATADANGGLPPASDMAPELADKLNKLRDILSGKTPIGLYLEFLYHHNKADLQVRVKANIVLYGQLDQSTVCTVGMLLDNHNILT